MKKNAFVFLVLVNLSAFSQSKNMFSLFYRSDSPIQLNHRYELNCKLFSDTTKRYTVDVIENTLFHYIDSIHANDTTVKSAIIIHDSAQLYHLDHAFSYYAAYTLRKKHPQSYISYISCAHSFPITVNRKDSLYKYNDRVEVYFYKDHLKCGYPLDHYKVF